MPSSSGRRRASVRFVAVAFAATAAVGAVAGCSAGQITQTDTQLAAVNGEAGELGALRVSNAALAYPEGGHWAIGADVPLSMSIANNGAAVDELQQISGPEVSDDITLDGHRVIPSQRALTVGGQAPPNAGEEDAATDSGEVGTATVVLTKIKKNLYPGMVVELTLTFRESGTVNLRVPIAAPDEPRVNEPVEEH